MERIQLKVLRVSNKLTQFQMAKELGINITTYCHIENGKANGSAKFWLNLQQKFNLEDADVWIMLKETCDC